MRLEIRHNPQREEPVLILEVPALTPETEALAERLRAMEKGTVVAALCTHLPAAGLRVHAHHGAGRKTETGNAWKLRLMRKGKPRAGFPISVSYDLFLSGSKHFRQFSRCFPVPGYFAATADPDHVKCAIPDGASGKCGTFALLDDSTVTAAFIDDC